VVAFWDGGHVALDLPASGALTLGRGETSDVRLAHSTVSRAHAVLHVTPHLAIEDLGSQNGTRVNGARVEPHTRVPVDPGSAFEVGSVMVVVQSPNTTAETRATSGDDTMLSAVSLADRVAPSQITVLLLGETGVGKGVLAERIHAKSSRAKRPFLPINCAALAETLLESELFGHEKGAFTGAVASKAGLIESAQGGTVFLDEVGDLAPATQVKLLRMLENREVLRLGARRTTAIDVRFIAATNRDLPNLVATGEFRQDLYFRLNGISLTVPPLRSRPREIDALASRFIEEAARTAGQPVPTLSPPALAALHAHSWPGNVRELRNVLERAVVLTRGVIEPRHLMLSPDSPPAAPPRGDDASERAKIMDALARAAGNQTKAAALLNMPRRTFLRRLDELDLPRPRKP